MVNLLTLVDTNAPEAGIVAVGTSTEHHTYVQSSTDNVTISWSGFKDWGTGLYPPARVVVRAIGGGSDGSGAGDGDWTAGWGLMPPQLMTEAAALSGGTLTVSGLNLVSGSSYEAGVRECDGRGLCAEA